MTAPVTGAAAWRLRPAIGADAEAVRTITRAAFAGQESLDPPSGAVRETVEDVATWIEDNGGVVVVDVGGAVVAVARYSHQDGGLWLRRAAVRPDLQGHGLGGLLLEEGEREARRLGHPVLRVGVRAPLVENLAYWRRRGFHQHADHGFWRELRRRVPVDLTLPTVSDTTALGGRLAAVLRAGDLLLLSGELGAGKTTLVRGLGVGLGVRGDVTSPTFVISRVHPSIVGGPALVHVDAYRLTDPAEVDDLDLDASLAESVTVVEWGEGKVEGLADDRLEVTLHRGSDPADDSRSARLRPIGPRWSDVGLG